MKGIGGRWRGNYKKNNAIHYKKNIIYSTKNIMKGVKEIIRSTTTTTEGKKEGRRDSGG